MKLVLTESQYLGLVSEQSMGGILSGQGYAQASTDAVKKLTSITFPQFIEGLREFLASNSGLVVQLLIEVIPGIGQFINVGAWSILGIYDIMLGVTQNKWNWFNIIVDICAIATTGPGGKYVKQALGKVAKYGGSTIEAFAAAIRKYAPKVFSYIAKLVKTITSFISKITGHMKTLISYFSGGLKETSIYKSLINLNGYLSSAVPRILSKVESAFAVEEGKIASTAIHTAQHGGEHYAKHEAGHAVASTTSGGHGGGHGNRPKT